MNKLDPEEVASCFIAICPHSSVLKLSPRPFSSFTASNIERYHLAILVFFFRLGFGLQPFIWLLKVYYFTLLCSSPLQQRSPLHNTSVCRLQLQSIIRIDKVGYIHLPIMWFRGGEEGR